MIRQLIFDACLLITALVNAQSTDAFGNNVDVVVNDENFVPSNTITVTSSPTSSQTATSSSVAFEQGPLRSFEKLAIIHGTLSTFAFLVVLPAGIFLARFTRTWNNKWYTGHWIIQFLIGGLCILIGVGLGFKVDPPVDRHSTHKGFGKVILFGYLAQCALGAFIHFVKIRFRWGRPPQNYFHAVLGLAVVGGAVYQIWLGFAREWPGATGRAPLSQIYTIAWLVWSILLLMFYAGGLALLPRQWRQERASRNPTTTAVESIHLPEYSRLTDPENDGAWQYRDSADMKRS